MPEELERRPFREVLERELALVDRIGETQKLVKDSVRRRAWTDFGRLEESMRLLGLEFEELDREREALFLRAFQAGLPAENPGAAADFYAFAARLPGGERAVFTELYRELRHRTMRIRLENDSLLAWLSGARSLVMDALDCAFPDRRGKFYTRQGKASPADMRSLVLDQEF